MLHNSKGLNKNYMWDVIGAENQVSQASIDLFLNQENMCEGWFCSSSAATLRLKKLLGRFSHWNRHVQVNRIKHLEFTYLDSWARINMREELLTWKEG